MSNADLAPGGKNLVLIGMPGVGKSTAGVLLAKELSRGFLDTDVVIQSHEGRRLRDIIEREGVIAFRAIEERYLLGLECHGVVIATGGSAVYSEPAMRHLRDHGIVVHLSLPIEQIEQRVHDLEARGIVRAEGQTLLELYEERQPLYCRYRHCEVDCAGQNHEAVVQAIIAAVSGLGPASTL
ncbi:MAG: shikimate kinase [Candidatus Hydrogenedentes bacterium]|nr:shikimate kinase [Candidatus Hydrogenedentota bacterium]